MAIDKITSCMVDINLVYNLKLAYAAGVATKIASGDSQRLIRKVMRFKKGTGPGFINALGVGGFEVDAGDVKTLDLYSGNGSLTTADGRKNLSMSVVRAFIVRAYLANASHAAAPPVKIAAGGDAPWADESGSVTAPFTSATAGLWVLPGNGFAITNDAGWTVNNSQRTLRITNPEAGANIRYVDIFVLGEGTES